MGRRFNDTLMARRASILNDIGWMHSDSPLLRRDGWDKSFNWPKTFRQYASLLSYLHRICPLLKTKRAVAGGITMTEGEMLKSYLVRVRTWKKHCNHDAKFMYWCNLTPGHLGLHEANGLIWEG